MVGFCPLLDQAVFWESKKIKIEPGKAICYSGFREGQMPGGVIPTYEEIKEDYVFAYGVVIKVMMFDTETLYFFEIPNSVSF